MTVAVIVQARFGSSRLLGKTLETIGDKAALLWCLDRCRMIKGVDEVVCAIPDSKADDPVADLASENGYYVTRGSENDVLARYAKAAREVEANTVIRVTSDCPFIDPVIAAKVLTLLDNGKIDYAANNMPPEFPHGLDCEAFSADLLYAAEQAASSPYEREHVTPWMRNHELLTRVNLRGPAGGMERLRMTLDYPQDLDFFRAVSDLAGPDASTKSAAELVAICLLRPDILEINADHIDEQRLVSADRASLQTGPCPLDCAA